MKRQRKAVAFSRYSFYLNLYEFNSLIYTHSIFNFIKQPLVYTTFFISAFLYFKMDSHHILSKIQMVDGISFSFWKRLRLPKIKKKVFYKPIAFSYAIIIFSLTQVCFQKEVHFWVHGIVPLFLVIVRKLSCLHFAKLFSFLFREKAFCFVFFYLTRE